MVFMARSLRLGAAQLNLRVGDISFNTERIASVLDEAESLGVEVVAFPELAITGYPPEDLLLKPSFVESNIAAIHDVARLTEGKAIVAVVGFVDLEDDLYNAAAVCAGGSIQARAHKQLLPNYGVFDEARYFRPGRFSETFLVGDVRIGVSICEDIWSPSGPISVLGERGVDLIVNINASPFAMGKIDERTRMLSTRAADNSLGILYVNLVGGQDELVFDGGSLLIGADGKVCDRGGRFTDELAVFEYEMSDRYRKRLMDPRGAKPVRDDVQSIQIRLERRASDPSPSLAPERLLYGGPILEEGPSGELELGGRELGDIYRALVLGTRDYVTKNGFPGVLVALSGGVDSALVATIAVDALGPDRVRTIGLPSRYSSEGSIGDARQLAENLGVSYEVISIASAHEELARVLAPSLGSALEGLPDENLQSRIRGNLMMAQSNASGWLVLTTSNKSELAVGYSTLYGDTAGGFAVIKDVLKTEVYALCEWRNVIARQDLIPEAILTKAPSAELRPGQADTDSLPPYPLLDQVLQQVVNEDRALDEVVSVLERREIERIVHLVDRAEYKRRQGAPGVKVSSRAFGKDRRMPITNGYR
jgi:NAD+ synthase (glutamine-hydrolysing)